VSVDVLLALAAGLSSPTLAPPVFISGKAVTFRSPPKTFICPLPKDWIGSDHGTTLFLQRPRSCARQGYPSSERNYRGSLGLHRIEMFYWYWMGEDEPPHKCHQIGTLAWMGKERPLCLTRVRGALEFWSQARFFADTDSAISIRLVTSSPSIAADLKTFRSWSTTVRACRIHAKNANGKPFTYGPTPDCPSNGVFF
jgi:hypothetical protein